jgi:hypothetical protein
MAFIVLYGEIVGAGKGEIKGYRRKGTRNPAASAIHAMAQFFIDSRQEVAEARELLHIVAS